MFFKALIRNFYKKYKIHKKLKYLILDDIDFHTITR